MLAGCGSCHVPRVALHTSPDLATWTAAACWLGRSVAGALAVLLFDDLPPSKVFLIWLDMLLLLMQWQNLPPGLAAHYLLGHDQTNWNYAAAVCLYTADIM